MVYVSQTSLASERAKRSLRKSSKAKQTAVCFANDRAGKQAKLTSKQASQANKQASKTAIKQPNKPASKLAK